MILSGIIEEGVTGAGVVGAVVVGICVVGIRVVGIWVVGIWVVGICVVGCCGVGVAGGGIISFWGYILHTVFIQRAAAISLSEFPEACFSLFIHSNNVSPFEHFKFLHGLNKHQGASFPPRWSPYLYDPPVPYAQVVNELPSVHIELIFPGVGICVVGICVVGICVVGGCVVGIRIHSSLIATLFKTCNKVLVGSVRLIVLLPSVS